MKVLLLFRMLITFYTKILSKIGYIIRIEGIVMPIIQVSMSISDESLVGLVSGDLVRTGGVVRDAGGHIFEHLKDASKKEVASQGKKIATQTKSISIDNLETSFITKAISVANNNKRKTGLIISGVALLGASTVYRVSKITKKKNNKQISEVEENTELNDALNNYITSARKGELTIEIIVNLKKKLTEIRKSEDSTVVKLDVKQLQNLIGYISKYTKELAKVNSYEIANKQKDEETEDNVVHLERYLEIQQSIFEKVA